MGRSSAQPGDVMGQTHCRESSMFSPLHEHGWLHSPTPGQEREWDDRRSSHEQGQGLNSAKLHRQKTAVMQNELFCVSAAVTVGRAQTSHLPCVRHSAWPQPTLCLFSIWRQAFGYCSRWQTSGSPGIPPKRRGIYISLQLWLYSAF